MTVTLYDSIVEVLTDYLGPAAQRFVDRQIEFHIHKPPAEIVAADLLPLIEWIRVSLAFLTQDRLMIDECANRLMQLA